LDEKPCCAAEALRRIRQAKVGGMVVGFAMLNHIIEDVDKGNLHSRKEIGFERMKRVKVYNYIPPRVEVQYRVALLQEFRKYRE